MHSNGIDLDVLLGATDEFRQHPDTAVVTIRTTHRWDNGFAVDGATDEIEEAGQITPRDFTFRTDWPSEIGGRDSGPSPGEAILGALGGCVAMTYIANATLRGIEISELKVAIAARVDLNGVFELDAVRGRLVRGGYHHRGPLRCRRRRPRRSRQDHPADVRGLRHARQPDADAARGDAPAMTEGRR